MIVYVKFLEILFRTQKEIDKLFATYRSLLPKSNLHVGKITTCYTNFMFDIGETGFQNNKIDLMISLESF